MSDAICLACRRPIDDHKVSELRECDPTRNALPYEEFTDGPQQQTLNSAVASSVTTIAAVVDGGPLGPLPTIVFRFFPLEGGDPYPDMALVLDDNAMRDIRKLVGDAADSAIRAARKARR